MEVGIILLSLVLSFVFCVKIGHFIKENDLSEREIMIERQEIRLAETEAKIKSHHEDYTSTKDKMLKYKKDLAIANEVIVSQALENDSLRAVVRGMSREIKDTHDNYFDIKAEVENG